MTCRRSLSFLIALVGAAQLGACALQARPRVEAAASAMVLDPSTPPAVLFADLERRLLEASALHLRYTVRSEGAFNAALTGSVDVSQHSRVDLRAEGTFGDSPATLHFRSDAQTVEGGSAHRTFREAAPPALHDALILGLTRMGLLHNLARLTAGLAPDHAGGGVREWVEVRDVQIASDTAGGNPHWLPLKLPIYVSGRRTAEATLWLDRRTGLPVRRDQVVTFPNGSMSVVEEYEWMPSL